MPVTYSFDFYAAHNRERSMTEQASHVPAADLAELTADVYRRINDLLSAVNDVTFVPETLEEDGATKWNLAHVIAHLTASIEERACIASILARGSGFEGSARFETEWELIESRDQIDQRLAESQRMASGYLSAWPDTPDLTTEYVHGWLGPMNAVACHLSGLFHAQGHLDQIAELVRVTP